MPGRGTVPAVTDADSSVGLQVRWQPQKIEPSRYIGTALSVQLGLGFALTIGAIWLMPRVADELGSWQWAFLVLAIGPFSGAAAMLALRLLPDSLKMAGGKR
jgi:hypothetical protein